ncbi:MAG TPA: hypothetical protein VFE59_39370, partial [Trebonia sp.]|nr:hypothetical protein [Trebonia sp.]
TPVTSRPSARTYRHDRAGGRAEVHRPPRSAAVTHTIVTRKYQTRMAAIASIARRRCNETHHCGY